MRPLKKILVASDFSGPSNTAYIYAQEAAKLFDGTVDALHVVPTMRYFQESLRPMVMPLDMEKNIYPKIKEVALNQLIEEINNQLEEPYRGNAHVIIERKTAQSIADFAKKKGYDLIVIGNIGSHGSETHRGTTAERIVRKSTVPVFAVPNDPKVHKIKNIIIPLDLTPISMSSIPLAVFLAKTLKAHITFLNVIELYESRAKVDLNADEEMNTFSNLIDMANKELVQIDDSVNINIRPTSVVMEADIHLEVNGETFQIPLHGAVRKGINAYAEIMDYASENADMLVMTTHGSEGITHFLLGSTTEKVVYNVDLPIITIKPAKK